MSERVVIGSVRAVININTKPDEIHIPEGIILQDKATIEQLKKEMAKDIADELLLDADEVIVTDLEYEIEE